MIGKPKLQSRWRSKLRTSDTLRNGTHGLFSRKGRTFLTAIGIAIGIASMVAVLGISASSKAALIAQIDRLGTNLLKVEAGSDVFGDGAALSKESPEMVRRIGPVESAVSLSRLNTVVQRTEFTNDDNGLAVVATEPQLLSTIEASIAYGRFIDDNLLDLPVVALGAVAAERLGFATLESTPTVQIAGVTFSVIGILESSELNPDLDRTVFISNQAAERFLGAEVVPTSIYVRANPEQVEAVRSVLPQTVNPADPNEVSASRPSDALEARAEVDKNLQTLLLGLGGVSLIVGGVGIANVMVISVLERRGEIGLRRALGATRRHIASQFIVESASLSMLGGFIGAGLGTAVTYFYAKQQGWLLAVPLEALIGGVAAALALGALAGLYPAVRAARLDPAEAVRPI